MTNAVNPLTMYLLVALGGACGASLRFFISQIMLNYLGKGFPFATLAVNISGSFVMGLLYGLIEQGSLEISVYRTLVGVGFLGAFTTFSTFSLDTVLLMQQGEVIKAMINIVTNVVLCLFAAAIGIFIVSNQ